MGLVAPASEHDVPVSVGRRAPLRDEQRQQQQQQQQ
jgi:hypothetical protein